MNLNTNNGLSSTEVLRYINRRLGASVQLLELSEKDMMNVVYQETLPTFSQYFPFLPTCVLTAKDRIGKSKTEYRIPNPWNLEILGIHKYVLSSNEALGGGWISPFLANPIDSMLTSDRLSYLVTPLIVNFLPPNRIQIKQNYYNLIYNICICFKCTNPRHLKTIQPNLRAEFLELCYYDVLLSLYPIRKRFENISTPYGQIQPFTAQIDMAQDSRTQLLQKWRENQLFNGDQKKLWIA